MHRSTAQARSSTGSGREEHSLHAPLLTAGAAAGGELEAADEVQVSCSTQPDAARNLHVSVAGRLFPSCLWSICIFALVIFTQDVCKRTRFNFEFVITTYSNRSIDALATILNCVAASSVLLAAAAVATMALCFASSNISMCPPLLPHVSSSCIAS